MNVSSLESYLHPLIARKKFQRFWYLVHSVSLRGMGYCTHDAAVNGEFRFLDRWAAFMTRQGRAPVIIDAGANEGDFAARFRAACPDAVLHCFEPNPATYGRLMQRFKADPGIIIHQSGLGEVAKQATLFAPRVTAMSGLASMIPGAMDSFIPQAPDGTTEAVEAYEVPVMRLDDYAEAQALSRIDYLKLDVEGYEKYILAGAARLIARGAIDLVHLEMNHHNAIVGMSLSHLQKALPDYDIYKLLVDGAEPLVTSTTKYNERNESYRLHNLVCIRRDSAVSGLLD